MSKFRLVILDNAKEQLDNPIAKRVMSDVVFIKQKNFLRSDPNYVVTDKHDMIGTHYLIYDTTELLEPKLVFAIRTTFMTRARAHRFETPLMTLLPNLSLELRSAFDEFHARHPDVIDCNAWFVDPAYSKKNAALNLSDLGYFMVCTHILRTGGDHFVGCTNETYSASRWLEPVGSMPKGLNFQHPVVPAPHRLILMEDFSRPHFEKIYTEYKDLISEAYEIFPATESLRLKTMGDFSEEYYSAKSKRSGVASAA